MIVSQQASNHKEEVNAQKPFILSYEQLSDVLALVFCTSMCCHISQKLCTGVTRCKAVNDELGCAAYFVCSNCQCQPLHMSCQVLLNLHPACHPCLQHMQLRFVLPCCSASSTRAQGALQMPYQTSSRQRSQVVYKPWSQAKDLSSGSTLCVRGLRQICTGVARECT